jgi:hypothetical protein
MKPIWNTALVYQDTFPIRKGLSMPFRMGKHRIWLPSHENSMREHPRIEDIRISSMRAEENIVCGIWSRMLTRFMLLYVRISRHATHLRDHSSNARKLHSTHGAYLISPDYHILCTPCNMCKKFYGVNNKMHMPAHHERRMQEGHCPLTKET